MSLLDDIKDVIEEKIMKERWSYKTLSTYLQSQFPSTRGLSVRSLERFCSKYGIHKTCRLEKIHLDNAVTIAVHEVGPTYGRKTITGLLASKGLRVSERRVGESLSQVNPAYNHLRRTATARQLNPIRYKADYFGHKLHIDQNEKLVMYGVTHVCAIDGFTSKIVGFITLPIKNNYIIYDTLFRPIILQYGMWDQIRVDHGSEWLLMLYVQEELSQYRTNTLRPPHLQTTSKQNHMIERLWVEVNARVNYPIKAVLVEMEENNEIDMDDNHVKFCVSWFSMHVTNVGTSLFVSSWNEHRIPGHNKHIPNVTMYGNNQAMPIHSSLVPDPDEAVEMYQSYGGHITLDGEFGHDPLRTREDLLEIREERFFSQCPSFEEVFHAIVNFEHRLFQSSLLCFIDISKQLETQL